MGHMDGLRRKGALPPHLRKRLFVRLGIPANVQVEQLTGGRSAKSYVLADRKNPLVLKIAQTRTGDPLFPIRPRVEAAVMQNLAPRGLCAQPVDAFAYGTAQCLIYHYLPGTSRAVPGPALARLLRKVHETQFPHRHTLPQSADLPAPLILRARAFLADHPNAQNLMDAIHSASQRSATAGQSLLHGDPVPGNVVMNGSHPMLIDWQCACLGDPSRDIAIAISPAMQVIHDRPPLSHDQIQVFLNAYGRPDLSERVKMLSPARHAAMIGHCLWRLDQGDTAYANALTAEVAALENSVLDHALKQE
ncbi:aminoglycoside phosphotransferase family protein [Meridianimarinicoccus aquatilis]|uniref:Aminoglycoside phosphotransferase family protein n=1 Tax=Meridianimarinicoccus aquatilis TaxID=2552766 RepID=A0A4R6ANE1_9RHOB|nr:aminoglycoside phosphotransferase family protein [Fluviibacterium aquatile]TDL87020.1 aminoglycoside phosphotransferase family protein [Fluviibacterium aquatile]